MAYALIQDGFDRFQTAFETLDKEYKRLQNRAEKRRRDIEKRAEKQVKRFRAEIRKNPVLKRAEDLREETRKRLERQADQVLSSLQIATRSEVRRLDRKIAQLNKKVRALEDGSAHD